MQRHASVLYRSVLIADLVWCARGLFEAQFGARAACGVVPARHDMVSGDEIKVYGRKRYTYAGVIGPLSLFMRL